MKHTGFIAVVLAGAVSLTAFGAAAQGPGGLHRHPVSFQALDADGDGEVSRDELRAHRQARFAEADADGDGRLDRDEMIAAEHRRAGDRVDRMLARLDTDGDSALSPDEMPKPRHTGAMFDRLDRDDSGGISRAEYDQAQTRMKGHMKHRSGQN